MADLFDEPTGAAAERDRYGRRLIIPPGGGDPVAYASASTIAGMVTGGGGLPYWMAGNTAIQVARDADLRLAFATMDYERDKSKVVETVKIAMARAGTNRASLMGTAVHGFTEPSCRQCGARPHGDVPEELAADVEAYETTLARKGLESVDSEVFIVNDDLGVCGSFDDLYYWEPAGVYVVADKKTGSLKPAQIAAQLAIYANGQRYDSATGERSRLAPAGHLFNRLVGLSVHLPLGQGRAVIQPVDLTMGLELARAAVTIWRSTLAETKRRIIGDELPDVEEDVALASLNDLTPAELAREVDLRAGGNPISVTSFWTDAIRESAGPAVLAAAWSAIEAASLGSDLLKGLLVRKWGQFVREAVSIDELAAMWKFIDRAGVGSELRETVEKKYASLVA